VIALSVSKLSSTQLAIIAAVIVLIGDAIALIAALTAFFEEQQSEEETKCTLEAKIKYLQDKLKSYDTV
jgi:cell division protein ZapA (FtsZ GTPase activity inhibitor)